MQHIGQIAGRIVYWLSWPFFWVYFRAGYGRTRIVVQNKRGELLVMKNWLSDGRWSMPGGGLHKNESATAAAIRELYEETAVVVAPERLAVVGQARYRAHGLEFDMYVFTLLYDGDVKIRWHEIADFAWVRPETLTTKNAGPDVLAALQMIQ